MNKWMDLPNNCVDFTRATANCWSTGKLCLPRIVWKRKDTIKWQTAGSKWLRVKNYSLPDFRRLRGSSASKNLFLTLRDAENHFFLNGQHDGAWSSRGPAVSTKLWLQLAQVGQNETVKGWKTMEWSDESWLWHLVAQKHLHLSCQHARFKLA